MENKRNGVSLKGLLASATLGLTIAYFNCTKSESGEVILDRPDAIVTESKQYEAYKGPKLILQRTYETEKRTQGKLYEDTNRNGIVDSSDIYLTKIIEPEWLNNERNVSCIPEGIYAVVGRSPGESRKFNYKHFKVEDVRERSDILFHKVGRTEGCLMTNDLQTLVDKFYDSGFQLKITSERK